MANVGKRQRTSIYLDEGQRSDSCREAIAPFRKGPSLEKGLWRLRGSLFEMSFWM